MSKKRVEYSDTELTRDCRRLKHLREYRHEQKTISNRS